MNNLSVKQQGATLIMALVMLVLMTLLAVSSINLSTINLKIVGNMQAQKMLDAAAQEGIERVLTDQNNFGLAPAGMTFSTTYGDVDVEAPVCIASNPATGSSIVDRGTGDVKPAEDNTWDIVATITDDVTGAVSTIHQGVEMRMLAGNCYL